MLMTTGRRLAWIALSLLSVLAATLLTFVARIFAGDTMYVFFVAAVTLVAWQGGWRFGLVATALSIAAVDYFFLEPIGSLRLSSTAAIARLLSFAVVALCVIAITRALRLARDRADAAARAATAARQFAERVSAERTGLLSVLSHEVRTPMNAILG